MQDQEPNRLLIKTKKFPSSNTLDQQSYFLNKDAVKSQSNIYMTSISIVIRQAKMHQKGKSTPTFSIVSSTKHLLL